MDWLNKVEKYSILLSSLEITGVDGAPLKSDNGFEKLKELLLNVRKSNATVYAIGNGASASMASHFSADLAKNGRLHTQVFSDLALITAISNDIGYDEVFSEPLRRRATENDLLIAISSSGNSRNIINAAGTAKSLGVTTVTISAMDPNNKLRAMGDVNLYVPAKTYGDAETCHAAILHYWIDLLVCNAVMP